RSNRISPTTAEHVRKGLEGRIDLILDAGPTPGGLESTVLDLTGPYPVILRPGLITRRQIECVIGSVFLPSKRDADEWKSPGMMRRHYSPRAKLLLTEDNGNRLAHKLLEQGFQVGWMPIDGQQSVYSDSFHGRPQSTSPTEYAAALYSTLHDLDDLFVDY